MKEFLLGLYIEYGNRTFPYRMAQETGGIYVFGAALRDGYIESNHNACTVPYKLTAKALEYIKA